MSEEKTVTEASVEGEYNPVITLKKSGGNFVLIVASSVVSLFVTKALSLGFTIPEEIQEYLMSGLVAFFSAVSVGVWNWIKHRNNGVATVVAAAAPAVIAKATEAIQKVTVTKSGNEIPVETKTPVEEAPSNGPIDAVPDETPTSKHPNDEDPNEDDDEDKDEDD